MNVGNRRVSKTDADHVRAKTELMQLRVMEKKKELVRQDEVYRDDRRHDGRGADGDVEHACAVCAAL